MGLKYLLGVGGGMWVGGVETPSDFDDQKLHVVLTSTLRILFSLYCIICEPVSNYSLLNKDV